MPSIQLGNIPSAELLSPPPVCSSDNICVRLSGYRSSRTHHHASLGIWSDWIIWGMGGEILCLFSESKGRVEMRSCLFFQSEIPNKAAPI